MSKSSVPIDNNKGITLFSLVITIIILLIFSMVAIRISLNSGIVQNAKDAAQEEKRVDKIERLKREIASKVLDALEQNQVLTRDDLINEIEGLEKLGDDKFIYDEEEVYISEDLEIIGQ